MQRWITLILGLGVVALVVAITVKSAAPLPRDASGTPSANADASTDAGPSAASATSDAASANRADQLFPDDAGTSIGLSLLGDLPSDQAEPVREGGIPLPPGSPRRVRF